MYDITIHELERLSRELKSARIEHEFEKGLDDDEEMRNLQDNIMRLYDEDMIICKMIDGYNANDYICDDPLINKLIECYYNTRMISEIMYQRMYERGMRDCIKGLVKIGALDDKDVQK